MKLYSEVPITPIQTKISYDSKILALGSCFAAEIGNKLVDNELQTLVNPFGTQFHPLAIEHTFNRIYARELYTDPEIFYYKGLYFSWDHSTLFSGPNKYQVLENINQGLDNANDFISRTTHFIITLGSAWAYHLSKGNFYVSNCHKVPQKHFDKILLSLDEITSSLRQLILKIWDVRPGAEIIFTISPVRHIRDGFRENNISKGILHSALYQVQQEFSNINYFPSYEIVMDELRDYRYYANDLAHMNDLGLHYIWQKFIAHYFTQEAVQMLGEVEKIKKAANHRAQNPGSVQHKKFVHETIKKINALKTKLPSSALNNELKHLKHLQNAN